MHWRRVVRTILGLAGVIVFVVVLYLGGTEALNRVAHGDPVYLLGVLLAIGVVTLSGSLRWRLLVSALTRKPGVPVHQIYYYNIIGRVISLFAPRGVGDLAGRPLALRAGGGSSLEMALYSTILDRLFDYINLMVILVPALLYVGHVVSAEVGFALAAIMVGASFLVVATRFGQLIEWLTAFLGRVTARVDGVPVVGRLIPRSSVEQLRQLEGIEVDVRTMSAAYSFTILQGFAMVVRSYLIAGALGIHLPLLVLMLATPVAQLGQLLAFTPGALGFRELSWFGVLYAAGISRDDLLIFLVGHRAYIYVSILVLALISQLLVTIWPRRAGSLPQLTDPKRSKP